MKKNSGENFGAVGVDPITGEYHVTIPEWIINELGWYEDTNIKIDLDGSDLILTENT